MPDLMSLIHLSSRRGALACIVLVAIAPSSWAAPSLRDVLSQDEFTRAGLNKLTPAELEFLSARLLGSGAAGSTAARPGAASGSAVLPSGIAAFGRELELQAQVLETQKVPAQVETRIRGSFDGWSGKTQFALDNGQVWQQVDAAVFAVHLESPAVTIRRGQMGAFYLRVDGYGSQVKVRRVK